MTTIEDNNSQNIIGGLNDTFFQTDPIIPGIEPNLLSPTDEINKKLEPYSNFIKMGHANTVTVPKNRDDIELFFTKNGNGYFCY